ncbi:MAG: ImmA/IrrE family metallo-endopeptidase [Cyclobacteriaceae bacterium]
MIIRYIEEKTESLLARMGINEAPVDPIKCAKFLNVDVQKADMDSDISGLFVIKDNVAYIRYNASEKNIKRLRFTIAHELGHFVLHKSIPFILEKGKSEKVMFRNAISSTGEVHREREANAFAASLLMPKYLINKEINELGDSPNLVASLAEIFNVSNEAMTFRLANLEMLEYGLF